MPRKLSTSPRIEYKDLDLLPLDCAKEVLGFLPSQHQVSESQHNSFLNISDSFEIPTTMKFFSTVLTLALSLTAASASPVQERDVQTVHLTFYGGPASYSLSFPADGTIVPTNNNINIDKIESPDYDPYRLCTFHTAGQKSLASGINSQTGAAQVFVGPPQPITGVSCIGFCLTTYQDCYRNGQYVGPCCNGFCAANKCRPYVPLA
ncbi:hypothetical protein QBC35DRAFT_507203 [Podospora australis]|uniref:Uncharacterized protein n=1 Tax=Podospora australis TaxID=1536484 RepID=A0AAN7ACR4_9PEZI|nr:hypothetical protein QBC35DRAFT_507203 [Podospora australis]